MIADQQDEALLDFVTRHPKLFVLTGAGCSTASGLGDYRDSSGQWKRPQPITGQVFINDALARARYWARSSVGWPAFSKAQPGPSHTSLQSLQSAGRLELLVTQNVDKLHQKAGHQHVVDLHGVLATVSCLSCFSTINRDDFQEQLLTVNSWLSTLTAEHAPDGDADLELTELHSMRVPDCLACGGLMKPDVVFFGENVPRQKVEQAMAALRSADAMLVVGSSLMVYSGFRFCRDAEVRGQPVIIVNQGLTRADHLAQLKIDGDCGIRLSRLARALS